MQSSKLAYSIKAYVIKLIIRQHRSRTLLVEGNSDKTALSMLLRHLKRDPAKFNILIDTAEFIKSDSKYGNREKVELVHIEANQFNVANYACFVDREYRDFIFDPNYIDSLNSHHSYESVYWTRGHSVENYFLIEESIIRFLEICFSNVLPINFKNIVCSEFNKIMKQAVAFSLAAYESQLITLSNHIVSVNHWVLDDAGVPKLDISRCKDSFLLRTSKIEVIDRFNTLYTEHLIKIESCSSFMLRWIAHGHLGSQVLWSGIGAILSRHDVDVGSIDQISRGQRDLKFNIAADLWSARCIGDNLEDTPNELIQWMLD